MQITIEFTVAESSRLCIQLVLWYGFYVGNIDVVLGFRASTILAQLPYVFNGEENCQRV